MQAYMDRLTDKQATGIADRVGDIFSSLPKLPTNITEFLVKVAPYLALLSAILTIIGGPLIGLLGTLASIMSLSPLFMIWTVVTVVLMVASAILMFMAFNPLKERQMKGWMYLFWAEVLSLVQVVFGLIGSQGETIIWSLLMTAIWFYVLFQMRPFYKKA